MPLVDPYGDMERPRRRPQTFDELALPNETAAPAASFSSNASVYPNGPWNDWPLPGQTPVPTPTTPAPAPTAPATSATDPYSQYFQQWYGYAPSQGQIASYTQQGQSRPGAVNQVLQNLYRESPIYTQATPWYADWRAPGATTGTGAGAGTGGGAGAGVGVNNPLYGNYSSFGQAWLASGGRTVQDLQNFIAAHPEYGATTFGSKGDKVTIGGRSFDAVIAAGLGGQGASWNDLSAGGGMPGADYSVFSDPTTAQYMGILNQRLNDLFTPLVSQYRTGLESLLGQQRDASKPDLQALLDYARQRFQSLQGPALTPQEQELTKTAIADPLEVQRQTQKQQIIQQASARGLTPQSGIIQDQLRQVDESFNSLEAQGNRQLGLDWLNRGEQRQQQALQVGGLIPQLQSEDLSQRAAAAGQLLSLEQAFQQQEENRQNYATQLAQELATLPERRLQLAQGVNSGGGGSNQLANLFQSMFSLANAGQNQTNFNSQQSQQNMYNMANLLFRAFRW